MCKIYKYPINNNIILDFSQVKQSLRPKILLVKNSEAPCVGSALQLLQRFCSSSFRKQYFLFFQLLQHIYIYIYICVCACVYICIYMHITAVLLPGVAATICILRRVPLGVSEVKAVWFLFQLLQL